MNGTSAIQPTMKNKQLSLISELSSYKGPFILFRLGIVSLVALSFMLIAASMIRDNSITITLWQYVIVVAIFNIITEMNVLLDNIFERFFPIPAKISLRVAMHFLVSLMIGFLALLYFENHIYHIDVLQHPVTWLMFAFGLIFVFILVVVSISIRITTRWIAAQQEVEHLKQLQLKNDYNALQDQLNPHFLFNSLSVLTSMIRYDPAAALRFTGHFTDTYRYVLQNRDRSTVPLAEELAFIHAYLELHRERLGDALVVSLDINPSLHERRIPPFSLQLLIENAIKHNVASKETPLMIHIFSTKDTVCVENNFQPRQSSYSTSKGLKNLLARYEFLTEQQPDIRQTDHVYMVELPLL